MRRRVLIFGRGVAGLSCARILSDLGWEIEIRGAASHGSPILVLNDVTRSLLQEIWRAEHELWPSSQTVNERQVRRRTAGTVSMVRQPGLVVRGDLLVTRLRERLQGASPGPIHLDESAADRSLMKDHASLRRLAEEFDWTIDAGGRASDLAPSLGATHLSFGDRHAICTKVALERSSEPETCWIETAPDGWAFMAPLGEGQALLQAMVPSAPPDPSTALKNLLPEMPSIKTRIAELSGPVTVFKASPQLSVPLCGPGWIAIGDAAVSLDPICGDGTGYALRGAILAASIIDGTASGLPVSEGLRHYTLRLRRAFHSHLKECLGYYSEECSAPDWQSEIERMARALSEEESNFGTADRFRYVLNGLQLVPSTLAIP